MTAKAAVMSPDVRGFFDDVTATWTYVVYAEDSEDRRCAIIDSVLDFDPESGHVTTKSADRVVDFIRKKKLTTEWILETHIHADHLTAAQYLKEKLGGKTAVSRRILKVLETWAPVFNNADDTPQDGSQFDRLFEDGETFTIGPFQAKIIAVPGHTPADTAYIVGDAVFVGDAMFLPDVGSGRCDFPGGSAADSYASARTLLSLPESFRMYVGHDYPPDNGRTPLCLATIGEQRSANIRLSNIEKDAFIRERNKADAGKPVPRLLFPSLQVNLRAGGFGRETNGMRYIKIPVDRI